MWWLTSPVLQRSILMKQRGGDMARRSSVDRLVRLLALPAWVADNDGATFQEAAAHFGVTPEVIRRDVETLWVSGLPGGMPGDLVDFSATAFEAERLSLTEPLGRCGYRAGRRSLCFCLCACLVRSSRETLLLQPLCRVRRRRSPGPSVAMHLVQQLQRLPQRSMAALRQPCDRRIRWLRQPLTPP